MMIRKSFHFILNKTLQKNYHPELKWLPSQEHLKLLKTKMTRYSFLSHFIFSIHSNYFHAPNLKVIWYGGELVSIQ